jgi:ATP-dependent Lon protease
VTPLPPRLPVLPLRDLVYFPAMVLPLLVGRPRSVAALEEAVAGDGLLLLLAQKDPELEDPASAELHRVGTVVRVLDASALPDGTWRVVFEGECRAQVERFLPPGAEGPLGPARPRFPTRTPRPSRGPRPRPWRAGWSGLRGTTCTCTRTCPTTWPARSVRRRTGCVSCTSWPGTWRSRRPEKQELLEVEGVGEALASLSELLEREIEVLRIEARLDREMHERRGSRRVRALPPVTPGRLSCPGDSRQGFPGSVPPPTSGSRWRRGWPKSASPRMPGSGPSGSSPGSRLNPASPEAGVIRGYLDWIFDLPWAARPTADRRGPGARGARGRPPRAGRGQGPDPGPHLGALAGGRPAGADPLPGGPPGGGKDLVRPEHGPGARPAFRAGCAGRRARRGRDPGAPPHLRGRPSRSHPAGDAPGRRVEPGLPARRGGQADPRRPRRPVVRPPRGPRSRSRTGPSRTTTWSWTTTSPTCSSWPPRTPWPAFPTRFATGMEVIRIPGYLETEKRVIARRFLLPVSFGATGWARPGSRWTTGPDLAHRALHPRGRGAGARPAAWPAWPESWPGRWPKGRAETLTETLTPERLRALLGPPVRCSGRTGGRERPGGNGHGAGLDPGRRRDPRRGGGGPSRLGQDSAHGNPGRRDEGVGGGRAELRPARAAQLGLSPHFHREVDVHVHIPEGATPKDGPSAGVTMALALISALTGRATRPGVALTGELTLRGRVLPVGGIREKTVAALRHGFTTVLLPEGNEANWSSFPTRCGPPLRSPGPEHGRGARRGARAPGGPPPDSRILGTDCRRAPFTRGIPLMTAAEPMVIRTVEYAGTLVDPQAPFPGDLPQVAFSGRSNVGKSSLINTLLRRTRNKIAHVSATPGKTQALNFFRVNDLFFLVDLPGFGYAKVPMAVRDAWKPLVEGYLARPDGPKAVVHLVDIRGGRPPTTMRMLGLPVRGRNPDPGGADQGGQAPHSARTRRICARSRRSWGSTRSRSWPRPPRPGKGGRRSSRHWSRVLDAGADEDGRRGRGRRAAGCAPACVARGPWRWVVAMGTGCGLLFEEPAPTGLSRGPAGPGGGAAGGEAPSPTVDLGTTAPPRRAHPGRIRNPAPGGARHPPARGSSNLRGPSRRGGDPDRGARHLGAPFGAGSAHRSGSASGPGPTHPTALPRGPLHRG